MTKYELLQHLERLYPSPDVWNPSWFICGEDEGIVKVCFTVDFYEDEDEESKDA